MVTIESGRFTTVWRKKAASTEFVKNQLVKLAAGFVTPSVATDTDILGVNEGNVYAASDTSTVKIPVLVPVGAGLVRASATGLSATSEGVTYDLTDSQEVDGATSPGAVRCIRYISATEGIFSITPEIAS